MRQRKIKILDEKLGSLSYLTVDDGAALKGKWRSVFPEQGSHSDITEPEHGGAEDAAPGRQSSSEDTECAGRPLFAEFGCGKGKFIASMASLHPDREYIAFEGNQSVVWHAMQKADAQKLDNVKFCPHYIDLVGDLFDDGELDGVYLNFSDPWPKSKHETRRLTAGSRLSGYIRAVRQGGTIEFRTDNDDLFDYTMDRIMMESGIRIVAVTRDLHGEMEQVAGRIDLTELTDAGYDDDVLDELDTMADLRVSSEYEDKFSDTGKCINYVRLKVI